MSCQQATAVRQKDMLAMKREMNSLRQKVMLAEDELQSAGTQQAQTNQIADTI